MCLRKFQAKLAIANTYVANFKNDNCQILNSNCEGAIYKNVNCQVAKIMWKFLVKSDKNVKKSVK